MNINDRVNLWTDRINNLVGKIQIIESEITGYESVIAKQNDMLNGILQARLQTAEGNLQAIEDTESAAYATSKVKIKQAKKAIAQAENLKDDAQGKIDKCVSKKAVAEAKLVEYNENLKKAQAEAHTQAEKAEMATEARLNEIQVIESAIAQEKAALAGSEAKRDGRGNEIIELPLSSLQAFVLNKVIEALDGQIVDGIFSLVGGSIKLSKAEKAAAESLVEAGYIEAMGKTSFVLTMKGLDKLGVTMDDIQANWQALQA